MDNMVSSSGNGLERINEQDITIANSASVNAPLPTAVGSRPSLSSTGSRDNTVKGNTGTCTNNTNSHNSTSSRVGILGKRLEDTLQESYSPWDMPPIIQPVSSVADTRSTAISGLKGFSNTTTTWPHFRSKPHPTLSVPITPSTHSRSSFDMAAPSTPPRSSTYSNAEDSDNAMCTPTFESSGSNYSRRNSTISVMALDTPPPLSLMDLESSSSQSGSSFGSAAGVGTAAGGSLSRLNESGYGGNNHGYPFPLFGMRNDNGYGISRRSSRTNSFSMDSRHVRKPSEDTHMSDGGNQSGSERSRRHSPAVVPFERSVRRSALLPKPKGLLKVFSQLEEEVHHNRHEYDHERETTQVRKGTEDESNVASMDTSGATTSRLTEPSAHLAGNLRRQSTSRLNPDNELTNFLRHQEEYDKVYRLQQLQHHSGLQQLQHAHPHPLQSSTPMQDLQGLDSPTTPSYLAHGLSIASSPSSPLLAPIIARASKRKSSTCEERFEPYHSSHLKRRAVSPSIGPMVSHRRSPSGSPARHLAGQSRSKIGPLPSPSGTGSFFRNGHGPLGVGSSTGLGPGPLGGGITLSGAGASSEDLGRSATNGSGNNPGACSVPGPSLSSTLNLQHASRSFSELSLGMPKDPPQ
ncbi:hypothetical protein KVV02_000808 [Mortierella alpina]|uniref:Uncharacterized protein n=1 Tax=Mortierella alpina TaxID=64518 RepID=A0A9P8CV52_MORAP|nr:hypothetical protein KVV02_000808 [Mortierella alpina]